MEDKPRHPKNNQEYFKKELAADDITRAAHYTYRDGFRLGFGIFIGFLVGSLAVIVVVYLFNIILRAF